MNSEVHSLTTRLDHVMKLADRIDGDDQLSAEYAKYLCVLVSGYVEESLRVLLLSYLARKSSPNVARFVATQIKGITNLKYSKLKSVLESFSPDWGCKFESVVDDSRRDALDSVVTNRHLIAHGKHTSISLGRIGGYYGLIKRVVKDLSENVVL